MEKALFSTVRKGFYSQKVAAVQGRFPALINYQYEVK